MTHFLILTIAIPLFGAFSLPLISKLGEKTRNFWVGLVLVSTNVFSIFLYKLILEKGTLVYSVGAEFPSLTSPQGFPVRIILTGDALSGFLVLIFGIIASLAAVYSFQILKSCPALTQRDKPAEAGRGGQHSSVDKFYALYFLLMTGILGLLLVGDFFTLFVFFEINSVATAGLIAFFRNRENFKAAFHYLAVLSIGSLFLLLGVGILYSQYGFLNMAAVGKAIQFSFLDKMALSFLVASLLLKAGFFPFYFWKPEAYESSPAPAVILFIISSVSVIYVLFKIIFNVFGLPCAFFADKVQGLSVSLGWILILASILSILFGVFLALKENNLKRILAFLAISELGYIILGISSGFLMSDTVPGFMAIQGGLFHLLNDVLDMGILFLIAGVVIYLNRIRNISDIRGLCHREPLLSGSFLLGILAISGMPPLNGFASKIMIYESVFHLSPILTVVGILGSILTLAVLIKVFAAIFLGAPPENERPASPGPASQVPKSALAIILIFAISIILIGLFPNQFVHFFIGPAARVLVNGVIY